MFAPPPLPRTLEASLRDLTSERPATRASAATDLTRHATGDASVRAQALPLLEKMLVEDESPVPRAAAAVALGDLGAADALPPLLLAIEDADVHVRQMALNALGEIGDPRAAPRLSRALADARPEVRYQAIIAFVKVADAADGAAALVRALGDEDPAVRYIAIRIAEEQKDDPRAAPQTPSAAFAQRVAALLDDPDAHVALAAAIFAGKAGDPAARPRIAAVVRGDRRGGAPEKEDEQEAVELAGRLDMRDVIPDLERRAWGIRTLVRDTCAWHARIALARMGHPRAVSEILRELTSGRRDVRIAAVVAAGRARVAGARAAVEQAAATKDDRELAALAIEALAKLA